MKKILAALVVGLSMFGMVNVADAHHGYRCKWVPGHYSHYYGHWIPGHKVCYYKHGRHCRWIHGRKYCKW